MKLDISDMDKFDVYKFDDNTWNDILKNINEQKDDLFSQENLDRWLKSKIKINAFLFQNIKDDPNASVKMVADNEYDIIIGKKLITLLLQQAYKIVDNGCIFKDIEETNLKHLIAQYYFYMWIDFICLHEFSHIVRSHLNSNTKKFKFGDTSSESKDNFFYEIDADRFAMKMATKRFAYQVNNLKKVINRNDYEIIANYLMSIAYLFDLFYLIKDENISTNSHPSPFQRIYITLTAFCESVREENLFSIEFNKLDTLADDTFYEFKLRHGEEYKLNDNYIEHFLEGKHLLESYHNFQKDNKLDEKSIIR